jgi:hypothetical protein
MPDVNQSQAALSRAGVIRSCDTGDFSTILEIINQAAFAYKG